MEASVPSGHFAGKRDSGGQCRVRDRRLQSMTGTMQRRLAVFGSLALVAATVQAPAVAQTDFDGYWSVEVVTVDGKCIPRTIVLEVRDGEVSFAGFGATAEGAIGSNGRLRASIIRGENVIKAKGSLDGELGKGSWNSTKCAGHWTARRG
jgi:hypothetical protein